MKRHLFLIVLAFVCLFATTGLLKAEAGLVHQFADEVEKMMILQIIPETGWKAEEPVTYREFMAAGQNLINGRGENMFVNDLVSELDQPDQPIVYKDALQYASFFLGYISEDGVSKVKELTPKLIKGDQDQITGYDLAYIFHNLLYTTRRGQDVTLLEERYIMGSQELTLSKVLQISDTEIVLEDEGIFLMVEGVQAFLLGEKIEPLSFSRIAVGMSGLKFLFNDEGQVQTILVKELVYPELIRVLISSQLSKWGSSQSYDFEEIQIKAIQPFKIISHQGNDDEIEFVVESEEVITFTNQNGQVQFTVGADEATGLISKRVYLKFFHPATKEFTLLSTERRGLNPTYAGTLEIIPGLEGQLYLINELPIEWYLKKVVPSEVPITWSQEAFKVQAVCARSYAISQIQGGRFEDKSANVDDSTTSQVYNNANEHLGVNEAIVETRGIVPMYNDEVIDAVFSSTSCGSTANNEDVWHDWRTKAYPGTPIPYLRARSQLIDTELPDLTMEENALAFFKDMEVKAFDAVSPYYRWRIELTREELENTINKNLPGRERADGILGTDMIQTITGTPVVAEGANFSIGTLQDLRVVRRGAGGNMMILDIVGSNGTYRVMKEYNIRFVIRPRRDMTGSIDDVILHRYDGSTYRNYSILPSAFAAFEIERDQDDQITKVTIYGGGNGHGVGMSQWGMKGMADQGYMFEEILKNYYTDIELQKIY